MGAVFVTRSQTFSYFERPGWWIISAFVFAQIVASVLGAYGLNGYEGFHGSGWGYVLVAWIWAIMTYLLLDPLKFLVRFILNKFILKKKRGGDLESGTGGRKLPQLFHRKKVHVVRPPPAASQAVPEGNEEEVPVFAPQAHSGGPAVPGPMNRSSSVL